MSGRAIVVASDASYRPKKRCAHAGWIITPRGGDPVVGRAVIPWQTIKGRGSVAAEAIAMTMALEYLRVLAVADPSLWKPATIRIRTDCQILAMALNGNAPKAAEIPVIAKLRELILSFKRWKVVWIPARENKAADKASKPWKHGTLWNGQKMFGGVRRRVSAPASGKGGG